MVVSAHSVGYDKCVQALEFHHLDPNEKEFSLTTSNTRSIQKLLEEAQKCILVCANCHREIHARINKIIIPGEQAGCMRLAVNQYRARFDAVTGSQIQSKV